MGLQHISYAQKKLLKEQGNMPEYSDKYTKKEWNWDFLEVWEYLTYFSLIIMFHTKKYIKYAKVIFCNEAGYLTRYL